MEDKWLDNFTYAYDETQMGVTITARGKVNGKEYKVSGEFPGKKAADIDHIREEMKKKIWLLAEKDSSNIDVPYDEVVKALRAIQALGGVDVRYDKLGDACGSYDKAQVLFKRLASMGYIKGASLPGGPIMAATLTAEGKSMVAGDAE
ncbi:MAG: hypothetical protein ACM3UZ_01695 [Acidobacteriota bacterium]